MRFFVLPLLGPACGLLLLHGCGLSIAGAPDLAEGGVLLPEDAAGTSSGSFEASSGSSGASADGGEGDALVDAALETGPACACAAAPTGWELVSYADDRSAACAVGLGTDDRVTAPVAGADACTCGCNVTQTPSCSAGEFSMPKDSSMTPRCNEAAQIFDTNNGDCIPFSLLIVNHRRLLPAPPSGPSACAAPPTSHPERVVGREVRVCAARGGGCVCAPNGPFRTCVRQAGDQACPSGFPRKRLVGTGVDVSCTACGCSVTTTCSATVRHYSDDRCRNEVESFTDTSCDPQDAAVVNSMRYVGVANTTCATTSASTPTAGLTGSETVCCAD